MLFPFLVVSITAAAVAAAAAWQPFSPNLASTIPAKPIWNTSKPAVRFPSCQGSLDQCVSRVCLEQCKQRYTDLPTTTSLSDETADYVSSGMFRDLSDYVLTFPWGHFRETAPTVPRALYECIRAGAVVFTQDMNEVTAQLADRFPRGFVLITTQTDSDPAARRSVLDHPNLIRWFAANWPTADAHPKLERIPLGLCYPLRDAAVFNEYGDTRSMHEFLQQVRSSARAPVVKSNLVAINFRSTHAARDEARAYFCAQQWATCIDFAAKSNSDKVLVHHTLSKFKFAASPRGNGIDSYRTYEALYMGVVPIVLRSGLDSMYEHLPVLIVDSWSHVTERFLEEQWNTRFSDWSRFDFSILFRPYWVHRIIDARRSALGPDVTSFSDTVPGYRCMS